MHIFCNDWQNTRRFTLIYWQLGRKSLRQF